MTAWEKRQALVDATIALAATGLNYGSTGNTSVRHEGGLLITPTGATAENISEEKIVEMDLDGIPKGHGIASSEWAIHTGLLASRPDLNAVLHSHAEACTALSCLRRPLPAFHYLIASFGGNDVRCSAYASFGSDALARTAIKAMEGRNACFLANHGMVVAGTSLPHALLLANKLETLSRQYILACQAGEPVILSDVEMDEVHARYTRYGNSALPR